MYIEVKDYLKFMVQVDTYVGEKLLDISKMFFNKHLIKEEIILDDIRIIPNYNSFNKTNNCVYMVGDASYSVSWIGDNKKSVMFTNVKERSPMTIEDAFHIFKYIKTSYLNLDYSHFALLHGMFFK